MSMEKDLIDKRIEAIRGDTEKILQGFQGSLIKWQIQVKLLLNVVNAVILAMDKAGVITQAALIEAGKELWKDHQFNLSVTQAAVKEGRKPSAQELRKSPIELLIEKTNEGVSNVDD